MLKGRSVLVTGGTGSFGRKMVATLLESHDVRRLVVFSRDELKQSEMQETHPMTVHDNLRYFIGDVRDQERLYDALRGIDVVIHAAALKQVPTAEYNPFEAVQTNVLGTQNLIRAAIRQGVKQVIGLSTDKAANPINLYGATKLCADKLFAAGNAMAGAGGPIFSVVRYGNVFGTRGSVVPIFLRRRETGVIPVTDERMTRFSLTLEAGVDFVLDCLHWMRGGEIFVPKLASYRILDVARAVAPEARIEIVGIRPGEKLHEVLVPSDESWHTIEHADRFVIHPSDRMPTPSADPGAGRLCPHGFAYSSDNNDRWLTVEELAELVAGLRGKLADRTISYGRQLIDDDDIAAVARVLRSDWLTTGPEVDGFEQDVARFVGATHAVAVTSGTAALHAMMFAIGIGPGDEVLVPTMTFAANANAVLYMGATPVFCDVDPGALLLDVEDARRKITERTRAIVCVDYAGQPGDYTPLRELAQERGLHLLADGCHALGATYKDRAVGNLADLTAFSFHPVKHLTTGEGGMVTTNDAQLAARMKSFRNHGIVTDFRQREALGTFAYDVSELGFNYRLPDLNSALGRSQLRKLPSWLERRRAIADRYDEGLAAIAGVTPLARRPDREHAFHLYVVRVDAAGTPGRKLVFERMRAKGIMVNVHYKPVHLHGLYQSQLGTGPGLCPVAEAAYDELLSLPMHHGLAAADVDRVLAALRAALEGTG